MVENEYKDKEKVLYKSKVRLSLPNKEQEEVNCFITKSHLVLEAKQPLRIPLQKIKLRGVKEYMQDTVALTYVDDLNKKQQFSMEEAGGAYHLNDELESAIRKIRVKSSSLEIKEKDEQPRFKNISVQLGLAVFFTVASIAVIILIWIRWEDVEKLHPQVFSWLIGIAVLACLGSILSWIRLINSLRGLGRGQSSK